MHILTEPTVELRGILVSTQRQHNKKRKLNPKSVF